MSRLLLPQKSVIPPLFLINFLFLIYCNIFTQSVTSEFLFPKFFSLFSTNNTTQHNRNKPINTSLNVIQRKSSDVFRQILNYAHFTDLIEHPSILLHLHRNKNENVSIHPLSAPEASVLFPLTALKFFFPTGHQRQPTKYEPSQATNRRTPTPETTRRDF